MLYEVIRQEAARLPCKSMLVMLMLTWSYWSHVKNSRYWSASQTRNSIAAVARCALLPQTE